MLALFSVVGGLVDMPHTLGGWQPLSRFLETALPASPDTTGLATEWTLELGAIAVSLAGIAAACWLYAGRRRLVRRLVLSPPGAWLHRFWFNGWGFDTAYNTLFIRPYTWFAQVDSADMLDRPFDLLAGICVATWRLLRRSQTGNVRWYAAGLALGAVVLTAMVILL